MTSNRSTREARLLATTVLLILGTFCYTVVLEPQLIRARALEQERETMELKMLKIRNDLTIRKHIEDQYSAIESMLPSDQNQNRARSIFSGELRELYSSLDLTRKSVRGLPILQEKHHNTLRLRVELEGEVGQILTFLKGMETSPLPIKIQRCELKSLPAADHVSASLIVTKVVAKLSMEET